MTQTHRNATSSAKGAATRLEKRREELLLAATDVFFASGFAGASVDEIIARAGGSKRTLYSYFGNKEELFSAVVQEICQRAMAPLAADDICGPDLETTLRDVGHRYLSVIMSPEALKLYRIVVAEGSRFPHLADAFFTTGPGRASNSLARLLRRMSIAWDIQGQNHDQMAEHYLGMIRDDLHLKVVLGLRAPPTPQEAQATVRSAADIFCRGVRRRS